MISDPKQLATAPSAEKWRDRLSLQDKLRSMFLSQPPHAEHARQLTDTDFQRIPIAVAINGDYAEACAAVCEAAATGAAAVLSSHIAGGELVINWPDGTSRHLPTGGPTLEPFDWLRAVACALVARDSDALSILCAPSNVAAAQLPEHLADTFWPFFCLAVAATIRQPEAAASWLADADSLLSARMVTKASPEVVRLQISPLIPLLRALTRHGDWGPALHAALDAHRDYYATEGQPADPQRLFPLAVTGLTALAFDRGVTRDAAGLPEPLVRGDFNRALVKVAFRYFPRFAEMTEDPVVFFDLEGIPSQDRKHAVIQEDGEVIARYEINERPGMPRSTIDFILPEKGRQRGAMRPTLDAGERILAAEMFAKRAGDVIDSRRRASQFLTEAINQVDLVLRTVPPGFDAVPESAFVNPAGQRVYQQEPGRFRRDRLTAYRDALRDRLAELSGDSNQPPRPETTREIQSYVQAMAAAEVIKQGVTPMLKSFAAGATADALVALRPRAGDYEKVFEPGAVETARAAFEEFWNSNPHLDQVTGGQTELRVFVAPGGMLRGENDLSRNFPSGYPGIASLLRPERVWVAWKFVKPGESSGIAYDGLVWCDDHWVWFPKPYRVLGKKNNP